MSEEVIQRLARLDSTVVSDALDACGLPAGTGELRAMTPAPRVFGVVRTVELEADPGGPPGPHIATGAIAAAGLGDVIVVANEGRTDVSCWGGILSLGSIERGVAGAVVDGVCRDVAEAGGYGFAVFARGVTPRTARGRLRQKSVGEPVTLAGISVSDGDFVVADDSGIAFIPHAHANHVLARAEQILGREHAIAAEVRRGVPLPDAMHDARLAGSPVPDGSPVRVPTGQPAADPASTAAARLAGLPTAAISDALDRLALPGSLHGIAALRDGPHATGPAFTVSYAPVDDAGGTVGDFLDDVPPGAVVVIDNQGRTDCTVWGGIMTELATAKGVAATVINGACRDTETSTRTRYPIWSTSRFMRTGKDRVRLAAIQQDVEIDSVPIRSGDIVCCDPDGVVVVPAGRADEVARLASDIDDVERQIVEAVRGGVRLAEARAVHGYHALQSIAHVQPAGEWHAKGTS